MKANYNDRVLALAGVWQAATLVDRIAHTGLVDSSALEASIDSVLRIDAADAAAVFGGGRGVETGLRALTGHGNGRDAVGMRLTRYVISLVHLERRLAKNPAMLETVRSGILDAQRQAEHFNSTHGAVLGALAHIYEQTFSTLRYRIQVNGEQIHLGNADNVSRIRALLLAGVRAAVLYHQCGGRSWSLLLQRRRLSHSAEELLQSLSDPDAP